MKKILRASWRSLRAAEQRTVRIEIDLNVRVHGNLTRAGLDDADGPLERGQDVTVYESESGLAGPGRVAQIDLVTGLVCLTVDWARLRPEDRGGRHVELLRAVRAVADYLARDSGRHISADAAACLILDAIDPERTGAFRTPTEGSDG